MSRTRSSVTVILLLAGMVLGYAVSSAKKENALNSPASKAVDAKTTFQSMVQSTPTPKLEGCVTCHGPIEPMHKYTNTGETLEKLKDGKDAVGLTCTGCHG